MFIMTNLAVNRMKVPVFRLIHSVHHFDTSISILPQLVSVIMAPVILTGPENLQSWLNDLTRRARRGGCYQMLFPSSSSFTHLGRSNRQQHRNAHLQGIADRQEREAACRLLRDSISGHIWAYMLSLVVTAEELFAEPALAVKTARTAATRAPDAPVTDRERSRLRGVYDVARREDYPTRTHFEQGQRWLDTATRRCR